jgi:hypothetical protein
MSDEITYIEPHEILVMNAQYVKVMEMMPPTHKAVTIDQLTALAYTIKIGRVPNADFCVFGKHGHRRARAMAFKGLVAAPGGAMHTVEILGPPDLATWKESYDCLFTALIMLDAVRRPQLAAYRAKICALHATYGPKCWALLYQADVRCRAERMDTLRYQLQAKHNAAIAQGIHSTFDTARPWDSVWAAATVDTEFWDTEFKNDALMIRTNTVQLKDVIGTDATVLPPSAPGPLVAGPYVQRETRPKATPKAQGKGVCSGYNRGTCHGTSCSQNAGKHICSICSNPKHGATNCPRVGHAPNQAPANDRARDAQYANKNWDKGKNKNRWGKNKPTKRGD